MLKTNVFNVASSFVITLLIAAFVFPHIPGIDFDGDFVSALLLTIGQTLITWGLTLGALIAFMVGGFVYVIRSKGDFKMRKSQATAWIIKQGFWRVTIGGCLVSVLLTSVSWKLAALCSSSLYIDGFTPIVEASFVYLAVSIGLKLIVDPTAYSPTAFRAKLEATLAEELANEANKRD